MIFVIGMIMVAGLNAKTEFYYPDSELLKVISPLPSNLDYLSSSYRLNSRGIFMAQLDTAIANLLWIRLGY